MLALSSKSCSVPRHSSFEPLASPPCQLPLSELGASFFSAHSSWRLPCDTACKAGRGRSVGLSDTIHRFTVQRSLAEPLNYRLRVLAQDAAAADAGVSRSNLGGYQSRADLFLPGEDADADRLGSSGRALHGIVSAAMEELRALRASAAQREEAPQPAGEPHSAYAWLNVNRPTDSNLMHVHDPERYSAVYFVAAGGSVSHGSAQPALLQSLAGRLIFRGGRSSRDASHTYLAALPEPGCLWVFPGIVPHCVMPFGAAATAAGVQTKLVSSLTAARISVAINLTDDRDAVPAPT